MSPNTDHSITRRALCTGSAGLLALSGLPAGCKQPAESPPRATDAATVPPPPTDAAVNAFAALEARVGGRLGVCVLDTDTGSVVGHRMDERFGMCSTFKVLLAAAILRQADRGVLALDAVVEFGKADMVPYAPVTKKNLGRGRMTIAALAEAAQRTSDNVAANLLLRQLGGPAGLTAILREIGDTVTRVDRTEPEMNLVPAGEVRDTTSPRAMAESVGRCAFGDVLEPGSRALLTGWMEKTKTGRKRIRAGLPPGTRAGNKTGTGIASAMVNKTNDVAWFVPPGRKPRIVSAYYESPAAYDNIRDQDQAVLADVGRLAASAL